MEKKLKRQKKKRREEEKKLAGMCLSFLLETNLCMPIGVQHFTRIQILFLYLFFSFRETTLSPCPPAKSEQNVSFFDIVVKLSDRPLR